MQLDTFINKHLPEAHRQQFDGKDWQQAAVDICCSNPAYNALPDAEKEEAFKELCSSPDPGCDCGFCATAPWK